MLYRVAAGTGFRARELRSLTASSLIEDGGTPCLVLRADTSKRRREDHQLIRVALATRLKAWISEGRLDGPLWPGTWHEKAAAILRHDLNAARQRWLAEAVNASDARSQAESDFLMVEDHAGRVADFHALRTTYISCLTKGGASVKQAQALARHSDPRLTYGTYSPLRIDDTATALAFLPDDDGPESAAESAKLQPTGTDDTVDDRGHLKCHQLQRETVQNSAKWRDELKARPEMCDDKKSGLEPSQSGFSGYNPRSDSNDAGVAQLVEQRFCKP